MQDVTTGRENFIGGSDVPAVMGISQFKTRFELLQEKAGLKESQFAGNVYTEYGNTMEPKIREYINSTMDFNFKEDVRTDGYMRYHADGYDESTNFVLEIKTTSQIKTTLEEYKPYLVQLLTGMDMFGAQQGLLAVYERPHDFSEEFEFWRLKIFTVLESSHLELLGEIKVQCARFWEDLQRVKENPLITEEELQPRELQELSDKILQLEDALAEYKKIEAEQKALKDALKAAMEKYRIKKWTTYNGVQITLVADGKDSTKKALDEKKLEKEYPEAYLGCLIDKPVKGKAGYVKITLPK